MQRSSPSLRGSMKRGREACSFSLRISKRYAFIPANRVEADAAAYFRHVQEVFKENLEVSQGFCKLLRDYRSKSIDIPELASKVNVLFNGHDDLISYFHTFLPKNKEGGYLTKGPVSFEQAINYVRKLKAIFHHDEHSYHTFIEILYKYRKGHQCSHDVYKEVAQLLKDYPDLLEGFRCFVPESVVTYAIQDVKAPPTTPPRVERRKKEDDFGDDEGSSDEADDPKHPSCITAKSDPDYRKNQEKEKGCDRSNKKQIRDLSQDCPDLISVFNNFVSQRTTRVLDILPSIEEESLREQRDAEQQTSSIEKIGKSDDDHMTSVRETSIKQDNDEYSNKPVSGLDLSNCKQCTPSYRLLPEDYPLPKVGSRTCLGDDVLNDTWVSVSSGSEDYSFKQVHKNQYEEALFKCEDDRYELDMLLASLGVAIGSVEELLKIMNSDITEETHIDDYLAAMSSRCIECLYGDQGLNVLDFMRQNPAVALPVILNRLKQKQDELLKCQADMNKVWVEVFAKNYHKSLDQGILYFKQQDQKNLSAKALLAEIKDASVMKRKCNDFIISKACGDSMLHIPALRLVYPDSCVNDDLYQLLKHSAKELCPNVEQSEKVLHIWKLFLEPLCHGSQESEEILKCKPIESQAIVASSINTSFHGERTSTITESQINQSPMNDKAQASRRDAFNTCELHTDESQQDAGRQCSTFRRDKNIASPIANFMSMHNYIDDVNQLEHLERDEREEGEISPSHTPVDEEQIINIGDAELTPVFDGGGFGNEGGVLQSWMPLLSTRIPTSVVQRDNCVVFYGNDNMYILLRLHQVLYERIHMAKFNAAAMEKKLREEKDDSSFELYNKFLCALYGFLDGTVDSTKFEDVCRSVGGNKYHIFLTIDKLTFKLYKQLQVVASDEMAMKLLALHSCNQSEAPVNFIDGTYHADASILLHDENVYRFEHRLETGQLSIQLIYGPLERGEASVELAKDV